MKTKLGRRGFMTAIGFGAAAAPVAGQMMAANAAKGMNMPGIGGYASGATMGMAERSLGQAVAPSPPWTIRGITEMAWKALHQKAQELEERRRNRWNNRIEGMDADLWAMKSLSMPARLTLQARRDRDLEEQISEAHSEMFGNPNKQPW